MLINCSRCQAMISDDRKKCPHCGTAVTTRPESIVLMLQQLAALQFELNTLTGVEPPSAEALRKEVVDLQDKIAAEKADQAKKAAEKAAAESAKPVEAEEAA